MAAGLGPQVRPDSEPLGHFHVIRWVDVVEHAAAGQLHLKQNTQADQEQRLRHENTRQADETLAAIHTQEKSICALTQK